MHVLNMVLVDLWEELPDLDKMCWNHWTS